MRTVAGIALPPPTLKPSSFFVDPPSPKYIVSKQRTVRTHDVLMTSSIVLSLLSDKFTLCITATRSYSIAWTYLVRPGQPQQQQQSKHARTRSRYQQFSFSFLQPVYIYMFTHTHTHTHKSTKKGEQWPDGDRATMQQL